MAYEDQLRHIARPDRPTERPDAPMILVRDYEALYYVTLLEEYAFYEAETDERKEIALGIVDYLEQRVRDDEDRYVNLYLHTPDAKLVCLAALAEASTDDYQHIRNDIARKIDDIGTVDGGENDE